MKKQGADVIGAKAGAKPKKPYIQKDTIGSTQNAEIVYGVGDGENGGLINGLNSIILDGTRVIGSSGEINFNEVKYEERFGLIDQPPLKLIEDTVTERGLNLEVRYAAPVVSSFNNKDADKFVVRISVPSLMQNKDNGDSVAAKISYAIDISVDGGAYQTVVEASATEKITNGYEFDHEIEAPEGTQRTIRVRRTMPDSSSQLLIDKFYVAAISEVINAKFAHPTLHYIGLVFNAEQFNNIPKVVFHYYGRKIKVPVNYNPTTRKYDGIWNGTFKVVYSNNPAWVLFDILTDRRSGLGRRIPVEMVDKWELYRIAQYCDELVPDGEGGMEPRFVCNNLVLNSKQDAYQVLKDIASIFRGQSFWNGSQVVTVADAPRDIDYAISMASVISYSYSGTARNARHNVVKVQYYDKNNENAAAYEYATDYDSIRETEQINEVEIRAFGCTSAGQAQRLARYTLLSEQTETRILTAKLSMDAFVNMQIGDVFAWSDKFLAGANNGGRVVAVNGAELTLDRDVTDSALVGDTLFVNTTSGKASARTITAINGNKVTLDAVMATTEPEFVWVIDSADLSLLYFKLDDYKVNPAEGTVDIVGIQHVNGKFGTIDTETALEAPPFSKVEIETLRAPGNVTTNYNVRVDQGINIADLYVAWGQVKGATRYTVEFRRDDQAWRILGTVTGLTHTIENVSAGIYEVRVRAADSIGNLSPYGFAAPINVAGVVLPPPKLTYFAAEGRLLAIATKWTFPAGTEASLAVVIEHATQDPTDVGVPTQKLNIPYPQTEYVFNGLGAHTQMWFRAAIVDKYNQEGAFTAWTTATADANPEELIDLISGHISEGTLDQTLKGKIDGAGALAGEAHTLANQAKTAAANAQTTATNAGTAAADAAGKATAAANAVAKEVTDRVAAVTAETNARTAALTKEATDRAAAITAEAKARTDGLAKEATDRATALTTQSNTLKADSAAKVKALKDEVDPKLVTLQDGITKVTTDYKAGDTAVTGQLNAYKTSNDSAVASVLQKADSAVSTGATNSSAITAINGQITTINNTKLDASVISGYYTKGQTDAKAAEIAAGKVEEFSANLKIGGDNLFSLSGIKRYIGGGLSDTTLFTVNGREIKCSNKGASDRIGNAITLVDTTQPLLIRFTEVEGGTDNVLYYRCNAADGTVIKAQNTVAGTRVGKVVNIIVPASSIPEGTATINIGFGGSSAAITVTDVMVVNANVMPEWSSSSRDIQEALDANSTAIQDTNAEVTRVDGVATAANNATTALAGRVSTVEGAVSTKAEAAALTALTTRVTSAEGVNTSQGSAITTLQNSVNHATTGLASKASSAALTAVDNKVTAANGRIDTTNSNVTTLTGRVSTVEGAVSTKAEAAALTSLTTRVSNAEGVNTTQGSAITSLENSVNHATTGLASKASSAALTAVDNKVTSANGRIDTTNSNVTTLTGRVSTVEGDVAKKADASALTALTTRVGNAEGVNTSQGSAITTLQNTVNHATTGLATKASTSALTATNSEVSRVNDLVTGHTNQLTQLSADITTINGNLATKADASALNDIYTKTQSDAKATEIAAGKVEEFNANLVIGGTNLFSLAELKSYAGGALSDSVPYVIVTGSTLDVTNKGTGSRIPGNLIAVDYTKDIIVSWYPLGNYTNHQIYYATQDASGAVVTGQRSKSATKGADGRIVIAIPNSELSSLVTHLRLGVGSTSNTTYSFKDVQVEQGSKVTAWAPSPRDTQASLDTNATAIENTNAEVSRVDGRVTTESNRTTTLTGRVSTVEGDIAKKADASALSALTTRVATEEGKSTSQGSAITALQNTINHATTGLATKAASSALTAVDNKVTAANGRIDTTNSNVTTLTGRVATVEGDISKKADASALTSLTTRVEAEEGKSTSQGTAITALQNSVNHATTGLATKASSAALTTVDNRVTTVDGRVNTTNSNVATLTGRVSTVEGGLTTKADVAAVNALTTRVGNVEGGLETASSNITSLTNSLDASISAIRLVPTQVSIDAAVKTRSDGVIELIDDVSTPVPKVIKVKAGIGYNMFAGPHVQLNPNTLYKVSYKVKRLSGTGTFILAVMPLTQDKANGVNNSNVLQSINTITSTTYPFSGTTSAAPVGVWREGVYYIKGVNPAGALGSGTIASPRIMPNLAAFLRLGATVPANTEFALEYFTVEAADADALDAATSAAVDGLGSRVTQTESGLTSVGNRTTALENAVNNATTGLASKASASAVTTLNNQVQHSTTGLSAVNTKVDNLKATVENTTNGLASKASSSALDTLSNKVNHSTTGLDAIASKTTVLESSLAVVQDVVTISDTRATNQPPSWYLTKYPRSRVNEFKTQTAIGVGGFFGGTYCNLETLIPYTDLSSGQIIQTATSANDPSAYVQRQSTSTTAWSAWSQPIKDLRDGLAGKAAASAVESLTTRVGTAEGTIGTEATKLTNLSTTVGGHTTTINSQTTSINGIRGVHAMKFETNGVISGYGLISELVNGTVKSQFGINANNFFIGAPSSNKKPFIVYTSPGLINGVTVPAGTYIDTAFIGAATIGTAHIRDLNVTTAKIGNGQITTAKIGDLQVDTLQIKNEAVTVPVGVNYSADQTYPNREIYTRSMAALGVPWGQWPTAFDGSVALWEAGFGTIGSITINRKGGKALITATACLVNPSIVNIGIAVPKGSGYLTAAERRYCRMVLSVYRGTTLIARTHIMPTATEGNSGVDFNGTLTLVAVDDSNITGNTTYTMTMGAGYIGPRTDVMVVPQNIPDTRVTGRSMSIVELKK